jgi:hypothetical protein
MSLFFIFIGEFFHGYLELFLYLFIGGISYFITLFLIKGFEDEDKYLIKLIINKILSPFKSKK